MTPGKVLALAPQWDTNGRHDATGAFQPEARRFLEYWKLPKSCLQLFNNKLSMQARRKAVTKQIQLAGLFDSLVVFSHGSKNQFQPGWDLLSVKSLAQLIVDAQCQTVALYCCSTGRDSDALESDDKQPGPGGDGGFADSLRDWCARLGHPVAIFAHACLGHTTHNPFVRVFEGDVGVGGNWVVEPGSPGWHEWCHKLASTDARFSFPWDSAPH